MESDNCPKSGDIVVNNRKKYAVGIRHAVNMVKKEFDFDEVQALCFYSFVLSCEINMPKKVTDELAFITLEHMTREKFQNAIERLKKLLEEVFEGEDK